MAARLAQFADRVHRRLERAGRETMKARQHWQKIFVLLSVLGLSAAEIHAQGESFPARPVRIISDSAPGSAVDVTLRLITDRLGRIWGQQVLAVNQPGAGGAISARAAAEALPDGYTLYMP